MSQVAEKLRAEAAALDAKVEESFERCDTDGFLSQWALGLAAQEKRAQANIEENGGFAFFDGLVDADSGEQVRAKQIPGKFGTCWALLDENDNFTGVFAGLGDRALANKGLRKVTVRKRAKATIKGSGTGLSDRKSVV